MVLDKLKKILLVLLLSTSTVLPHNVFAEEPSSDEEIQVNEQQTENYAEGTSEENASGVSNSNETDKQQSNIAENNENYDATEENTSQEPNEALPEEIEEVSQESDNSDEQMEEQTNDGLIQEENTIENDENEIQQEEIESDKYYQFKNEETGIIVSVPGRALPENSTLDSISVYAEETENTDSVSQYFSNNANFKVYSIDLIFNDEIFEPEDIIVVSIPVQEGIEEPYVYYVSDDGLTDMHAELKENSVVFTSSHLSYYVLSDERKIDEEEVFENNLPVVSLDDLTWFIQEGGSAVGFIGSDSDEDYQELLSYYSDIYESATDEVKSSFQRVDQNSIYDGGEIGLLNAAYDASDREKITSAVRDVINNESGHSVVIYSYNKNIVKVSTIPSEIPEGASLESAAHIDFSSTYQPSVKTPQKSLFMLNSAKRTSTPEFPEGYEWNLNAKAQIQPFTAEISGTYKVELWGADGDSDTNWPETVAAGVGGRGGYTTAEIHLNKGETIYFGLGFRNGFSDKRSWNGGGAGWGLWANYAAGGGGAAAMYSQDINGSATAPSTTELSGYINNKDKVLLVAGGGGGAENYFAPGQHPYPCDDGHCTTAYGGGGGGAAGGKGSAVHSITVGEPGTQTTGYAFGQGQDYPTTSLDASTGAGGGGWFGGYSVPNIRYESGKALQGGSGGGGSGYINKTYVDSSGKVMQNTNTVTGGHLNFDYSSGSDDGRNAHAKITFKTSDSYNLSVQYLLEGTETPLHEQNDFALKKGDSVKVPVYHISGYTVTGNYSFNPVVYAEMSNGTSSVVKVEDYFDLEELISEAGRDEDEKITGTMPATNIVLKIYYNYPLLRIKYIDYETKNNANPVQVANTYEQYIRAGQTYNIPSPAVPGYINDIGLYESHGTNRNLTINEAAIVTGEKSGENEFYTVYYVPLVKPTKDIIEKNGMPVSKAVSKKGVQLMANDQYTYSINWENKQHQSRVITIIDKLPSNIEVIEDTISDGGVYDSAAGTITWTVNAPERTSDPGKTGAIGTVTFRAKVKESVTNGKVENNISSNDCSDGVNIGACPKRTDPVVHYSIIKSSDPVSESDVAFDQIVTYYIDVKNDGNVPINNLAVVDYIPKNMGDLSDGAGRYPSVSHDYHGDYNKSENYVHFLIDELPVGSVARLSFKVAVTAKQESTNKLKISNFAYHGVLPINNPTLQDIKKVVNPDGDSSTDDGKKTNVVNHYAIGPKVEVIKSSNPVSGTKVNNGQRINYSVDLTNIGTVNTNWVRLVDKIPAGSSYVPNSLSLVSDNTASNDKYAWMSGTGFDVHYDTTRKQYRLENISPVNNIHKITVTWPSGLSIVSGTYSGTVSGNTLVYETSSALSADAQKTFLSRIRWSGNYNVNGTIKATFTRHNTKAINQTFTTVGSHTVSLPETKNQPQTYTITAKGGQGGGGSAATQQSKNVSVTNGGTVTLVVGAGGIAPSTTTEEHEDSMWIGDGRDGEQDSWATYTSGRFSGKVTDLGAYNSASAWWGGGGQMESVVRLYNGNSEVWSCSFSQGERCETSGQNISNGYISVSSRFGRNPTPHAYVYYKYNVTVPVAGGNGTASSVTVPGGASVSSSGTAGTKSGSSAGANGFASISGTASWYEDISTSSSAIPFAGDSKGCKFIPVGTRIGGTTVTQAYVECLTSDLAPNQSARMTFAVTVNGNAASIYDEIDNTALYETKFTVDNSHAGTNPNMPGMQTNTTIHPLGNIAVTAQKTSSPASGTNVNRNDKITYSITLKNTGSKTAKYVHVRDYVPTETTYAGGINENGVYVAGSPEGGNYVEWLLSIPSGGTKTVTYSVNVNVDAPANYNIVNQALYEAKSEPPGTIGTIKPDPSNVTNQVYHVVYDRIPKPDFAHDIAVEKSGEVSNPLGTPASGTEWQETAPTDRSYDGHDSFITYTLRVANSSKETTDFVRIRDVIPDGTTFVQDSFGMIPSPTTERFSPNLRETHVYSEQGNYVEWIVYNVGGNDFFDLTYKVKIDKYAVIPSEGNRPENVIHNTAYYQEEMTDPGEPGTKEEVPSYETNEVRTPLVSPHVKITDVAEPVTVNTVDGASEVKRREIITYVLNVTNDSDVFLNYAVVESTIPNYTEYVEDSIHTFSDNDVKLFDETGNAARFIVKDLAPGDTKQVSFQVQVNSVAPIDTNIINYALVKGYFLDPVTPEDIAEPSGTRNVNGGEGYSNQQVHVLAIDVPPSINDPYKRVYGAETIIEGLENRVDYTNSSFTYDIYQEIPEEDAKAYFNMFMVRDSLPTNVLLESVEVFANGNDVTNNFEYNTTINDKDKENVSHTVVVSAKPEFLETAEAYGKTYDFKLHVKIPTYVQKESVYINSAKVSIHYNDSELESNFPYGSNDTVSDDDPGTRTTNTVKTTFIPKIPFKKLWTEEDGYYDERPASITLHLIGSDGSKFDKALTEEDNWEWVFTDIPGYTSSGEKITYTLYEDEIDMYDSSNPQTNPLDIKFNEINEITNELMLDFPVEKKVFNADNVDIDNEFVLNDDTLKYVIYVTNPSKVSNKKFDIEDVIPDYATYVTDSASDGGVYDAASNKITWSNIMIAPLQTRSVEFEVKTISDTSDFLKIQNFANIWMQKMSGERNERTKQTTNTVTNYILPYEDGLTTFGKKTVTDIHNSDINTRYVQKDDILYYHITFENKSERDANIIVTDTIPENTEFVAAQQNGTYSDGMATWKTTVKANSTEELTFQVKATQYVSDIKNTANVEVDHVKWITNEVVNQTAKITINKTIKNYYESFGKPSFVFKITGSDGSVGFRMIEITNQSNGTAVYEIPRYTESDTTFTVSESDNLRYSFESVSTSTSETAKVNGKNVDITFSENNRDAVVDYSNIITKWDKASHADSVINDLS